MQGYTDSSYGDAFADVYDEWYHDVSNVEATVRALRTLCGDGSALELGIGTGRLAIPLAGSGVEVHGIDTSQAMLDQLAAKDLDGVVITRRGDMVDDLPAGPFSVVFVAYNTFFNLLDADRQARCFAEVTARLAPGGVFVIEAFVPEPRAGQSVTVRSLTADRVVLSVSVFDEREQRANGQLVEFTEAGGVRLRPWSIRYATTDQLDAMARAAGMELQSRHEDFDGSPFTPDSPRHVSVYGVPTATGMGPPQSPQTT